MGELRDELGECGLPSAMEAVGDRWSFMILRAAFNGVYHFEDFLEALGIARNILSNRLGRLVDHGIMQRTPMPDDRRKIVYCLTDKGIALLPALIALRQWGETYGIGVPSNPVLADRRDGQPIGPVTIRAHDGRVLRWEDLKWLDRSQIGTGDADCCEGPVPERLARESTE